MGLSQKPGVGAGLLALEAEGVQRLAGHGVGLGHGGDAFEAVGAVGLEAEGEVGVAAFVAAEAALLDAVAPGDGGGGELGAGLLALEAEGVQRLAGHGLGDGFAFGLYGGGE